MTKWQHGCIRLPQRLCACPNNVGLENLTLSVLSMALVSRWVPSGLTAMPVTVSLCPFRLIDTSSFRRSHTFTTFSMPDVYTCQGLQHRNQSLHAWLRLATPHQAAVTAEPERQCKQGHTTLREIYVQA